MRFSLTFVILPLIILASFSCRTDNKTEITSRNGDNNGSLNGEIDQGKLIEKVSFSEKIYLENEDFVILKVESDDMFFDDDSFFLVDVNTENKIELPKIEINGNFVELKVSTQVNSGLYFLYIKRKEAKQNLGKVSLINNKSNNLKIVAHRGGSMESGNPDNSLSGLGYSLLQGVYAAEIDIYITKDDSVVVCHTEKSPAALFGGMIIYENNYIDLKSKKQLSNGEDLPLIQDFFSFIKNNPSLKLWLDVKSIDENNNSNNEISAKAGIRAAEIAERMGVDSLIEFIVGRKGVLDIMKNRLGDSWKYGYMNYDYSPQQFINAEFDWANFNLKEIFYSGNAKVSDYTDRGIRVSVFNADSDNEMAFFLNIKDNLYAICTNYPKKLKNKLKKY